MTRLRRTTAAERERHVELFNRFTPVGSAVVVRRDNGDVLETHTRSEAWVMGGHSAVVKVDGIAGGYALDRVIVVANVTPPAAAA